VKRERRKKILLLPQSFHHRNKKEKKREGLGVVRGMKEREGQDVMEVEVVIEEERVEREGEKGKRKFGVVPVDP
jgi:hypothetical protein